MPSNSTDANPPESQQPITPDSVAHALALYEKAKALRRKQPLDPETARLIITLCEDALKGLGPTNQEVKVDLERFIEEAREARPPGSLKEFKSRVEGSFIRRIYPSSPVFRGGLYALVFLAALLAVATTAIPRLPGISRQADEVKAEPEPTPLLVKATPTPREVEYVPTPTPTPAEQPTPSPTPTPQPSPTPPAEKRPVYNATPSWGRLIYQMQWRVLAIQSLPGRKVTRVFFEIRNVDASAEMSCYSFDGAPLILVVKGSGRSFSMLGSAVVPEDIEEKNKMWHVQAGRTIQVAVDFDVVLPERISGAIEYRDNNHADPAQFLYAP